MSKPTPMHVRLSLGLADVARQALRTCFDLFKVIVPIILVIRLLELWGAVAFLGRCLGPVMKLVGLPGETGLVWATAMVTNLYGGAAVFVSVGAHISAAQATVLTTMMLIAHGLPVELRIAQKAGTRFRMMAVLRVGGALLAGFLLYRIYLATGWLQRPNVAVFRPAPPERTWPGWLGCQGLFLLKIVAIVFTLMLLLRVLKAIGITALLARILAPALRLLGMSHDAAPVTVVGMTLGLTYGGGLIIQEARAGILSKRDVFFALALMGLCHSVIEDTLLMMMLGGHVTGVLIWRAAFSLAAVFVLVRVLGRVSDRTFEKHFCRPVKALSADSAD